MPINTAFKRYLKIIDGFLVIKFVIQIIEKYAKNEIDAKMLLAMNALLPNYEGKSCKECCEKFVHDVWPDKTWPNPYQNLQKTYEPRAVCDMVSSLMTEITTNARKGIRSIAKNLILELNESSLIGKTDIDILESVQETSQPDSSVTLKNTSEIQVYTDIEIIQLNVDRNSRHEYTEMGTAILPLPVITPTINNFKKYGKCRKKKLIYSGLTVILFVVVVGAILCIVMKPNVFISDKKNSLHFPTFEEYDADIDDNPKSEESDEGIRSGFYSEDIVEGSVSMPDWGDNEGGRSSYTASQVDYGILGNQIVFNSINGGYCAEDYKSVYPGDEKDFVRMLYPYADPEDDSSWESEGIIAKNGEHYMVKLYINNNNRNGYNAVAKDTKVALSIPTYSDTQILVRGYIESSNASPSKYWDSVMLTSENNMPFHLKFISGSAMLHNNSVGAEGLQLSDDIVLKATEGGTLIGYNSLDGEMPGGSQYASEVTAWIDVIYDPCSIKQKVRKLGDKEWKESLTAQIGDQMEFQMEYVNISNQTQRNVMIRDILPSNLKYVEGTTKLYNVSHPNGATLTPDGDLFTHGINIGAYTSGSNAYVRFTAEVVDMDLGSGSNTLFNWWQASIDNSLVENPTSIVVQKVE